MIIVDVLTEFPAEVFGFAVLVFITVFRRQLSTNHSYRETAIKKESDESPLLNVGWNDVKAILTVSTNTATHQQCGKSATGMDVNVSTSKHEDNESSLGLQLGRRIASSISSLRLRNNMNGSDETSFNHTERVVKPLTMPLSSFNQNKDGKNHLDDLSQDVLLNIASLLTISDIGSLSCASNSLYSGVKSDFIWEQLWRKKYGPMWSCSAIKAIRAKRRIHWDPSLHCEPPSQGWFIFYLEFEFCWVDWLLAGCCTSDCCIVGIHGVIYDVTSFLPQHPGSPESLTEGAGCDGTENFLDIGHSTYAMRLAKAFIIWEPKSLSNSSCRDSQHNNNTSSSSSSSSSSTVNASHDLRYRDEASLERNRANMTSVQSNFHEQTTNQSNQQNKRESLPYGYFVDTRFGHGIPFHRQMTLKKDRAKRAAFNLKKIRMYYSHSRKKDQRPPIPNGSDEEEMLPDYIVDNVQGFPWDCRYAPHPGQCKVFYDPLQQEWYCWWTCCGGYRLLEIDESDLFKLELRGKKW